MTSRDAIYICYKIVLDYIYLYRDLTRVCMNACLETRVASDLFIVELIVFGWSKTPSLFNIISELKIK